jgi:hypothetical protein
MPQQTGEDKATFIGCDALRTAHRSSLPGT